MGRTFAAIKDYRVDGNKEMMAIGLMNMAGSCTSNYVTTGIYRGADAIQSFAVSKTARSIIIVVSCGG